MRLAAHGRSDIGRVRSHNEDCLKIHWHDAAGSGRRVGVLAVADGVGGRKAGEVASAMFCNRVVAHLSGEAGFDRYEAGKDRELRSELIQRLGAVASRTAQDIFAHSESESGCKGMATTGIVAVVCDGALFLAHVGDSRAYLIRGEKVFRLTEDHSMANMLVRQGLLERSEAIKHPMAERLAQAYGQAPHVEPDTLHLDLEAGDRVVLCTDGIHRYVGGKRLKELAAQNSTPEALVEGLIAEALEGGGVDNATVVVLQAGRMGPETRMIRSIELGQRIKYMNDVFLFGELSDAEILGVMKIFHQVTADKGESIIRDGDRDSAFYVVLEGTAVVSKGGEVLTGVAPGAHFGEFALVDDHSRSADVVAQTDMTMVTCSRDDLLELFRHDPRIGNKLLMNFLRYITRRMRELSEDYRAVTHGEARVHGVHGK